MTLALSAWTAALRVSTPAILLYLARRSRRQTGQPDDWRMRLGFGESDSRRPVWIHAASAGEVQAATPLAAALSATRPVRLTAFTASGRLRASELLPDLAVELAPLDLPGAWRRYLRRVKPRLAVLVETELWPNLLASAHAHDVPVVLVSARLTPDAAGRLARLAGTTRTMLGLLARVLAQTQEDLERFVRLGLPAERGEVAGNLKDAAVASPAAAARGRALRDGPLAGCRVWVAGSVREGEEDILADAFAAVRARVPECVAIIVPRYPEQAPGFSSAFSARGIPVREWHELHPDERVPRGGAVVVDRLGVLQALYAAADVAFVGGTLVPLGGHNLLEPALAGVPLVVGPNLDHVREAARRIQQAAALAIARDAGNLANELVYWLRNREAAKRAGEAAGRAASRPAALEATLTALSPYL